MNLSNMNDLQMMSYVRYFFKWPFSHFSLYFLFKNRRIKIIGALFARVLILYNFLHVNFRFKTRENNVLEYILLLVVISVVFNELNLCKNQILNLCVISLNWIADPTYTSTNNTFLHYSKIIFLFSVLVHSIL